MKISSLKKRHSKRTVHRRTIFWHVKFNVYPFVFVRPHPVTMLFPSQQNERQLIDRLVSVYNVPVLFDSQTSKPATLHLSQVVNRVSRCHYVLRRYVREAEKYAPKPEEKPVSTSKTLLSNPSHESKQRSSLDMVERCFFRRSTAFIR